MNPILYWVDGYKLSHYNQFPSKTTKLFYYYESRGGLLWVDENLQVQSTTNYEEWVKAPSLLQECFRDGEILIKG